MSEPNVPPTRRDVLRRSATLAAAPFVLGPVAQAAGFIPKDDPDVLRIGLVGCGGRGTGAAYNALYAEDGTVVLTAMADVFPDKIDRSLAGLAESVDPADVGRIQVDEEHRFVGFDAAERLIASDEVDVVLLATPPHFRPAHLAAAVAAGKHVFTEKPMAVDAPGVRSVLETVEAARAARLSIVAGYCWRYNIRHQAFYERVLRGSVGDIRTIYSTYNASPLGKHPRQPGWSDMEWQLRNWQHFGWLAGDHIVEQAVHSIDKMAWAMGDVPPVSCTAVGGNAAREGAESGNIFDHFGVTYEYADGVKGFHMCRQMSNTSHDISDYVHGSAGIASIVRGGWGDDHTITGPGAWAYEGPGNDMYQHELDELFRSIRAGEPVNDGVRMARSTLLAILGREAAYTGQTITWEQMLASESRLGPETYAMGDVAAHPVPVPGKTKFA